MDCRTVTIRLAPLLPTTVAVVQFPDVRRATQASIEVMNRGVGIRMYDLPAHMHYFDIITIDI